ncbi:TPA: CDP-glycerol glycerophosphotransferase family protein [Clostridium perfringens]|nr:CDP-glycerol glycerophosphotransferase family protein [Clostridium perfringens]EJT6484008.1 CDP-glycerol glycerophosphotransferase family protein [Clostridium perfringens]ELC8434676.1 CDP-glycerol glycerophosphotransferase family protein [Clostridium perfringens]MDU4221911.1 CDP-glycerol glycerophosphotransferase family protein [Clostridium perfringens]BDA23154.1 hypothetical protein CPBEC1_23640 [Clostridium perfringens]
MLNLVNHIFDGSKLLGAIIISPIYKFFKKEEIYLIGERKDQCQDNGYHLFKYVREKHSNDKIYYCITRDSKQLEKIKYLGNIVYYKSFKHYLYYILSNKLVCAHVGSCTPDTPIIWKIEEKNIIKKNRVFIQHGITKELIPSLMKKYSSISTFICGAKPEYEFVKNEFGYMEENVKYLGFCRFDNLHDIQIKNQILVMPTWRQWFGMNGNNEASESDFISSEYFNQYNNLINSEEINNILEKQDLELIFYPHNEMQRYLKLFNSKFERIKIANKDDYDVQTLLKESKVLITDYSSVAFDFAYMKKPIIYYQFDKNKYDNCHYSKGYFEYERDGFGPVVDNIENIIEEVANISIKEPTYIERSESFFTLYDKDNCKRIYNHIKNNSV